MEQRIINLLTKHALTRNALLEFFSDERELDHYLNKMIDEGKLVVARHKYYLPSKLGLEKGKIVTIKDRFSFADLYDQEEDAYIDNNNLNGAFVGDEVWLRVSYSSGYKSYEVFSIIKRGRDKIVGEIYEHKGEFQLKTKDIASKNARFIVSSSEVNLFEGYIVTATVEEQVGSKTYVHVYSILGHKNEPGMDISRIILNHDADIEFPLEVREELKTIPTQVEEVDKVGRKDFRDHLIVTIDGEDARDFDDAVEVERTSNGYRVGVHIADVSHYVKEDSPLDKEALSRGCSIYVTDRVVPMLPVELSNGICSLNEGVDRLVTSCIFEVDNYGNISNGHVYKGLIRSKGRLTYTYVNKLFKHELKKEEHKNEEIDQMLFILNEVAHKIRKRRNKEGAINIESTELRFICDEQGNPLDVVKRKQEDGEELIEDLMISANEVVAGMVERLDLPFAYRIHEQPKSKKIDAFIKLSNHLGYHCDFNSLKVSPLELAKHLDSIEKGEKKEIISMMLLRSLAKARYSPDNKGHFGLASHTYCHFTSPIRRYPDLLVHRLLERYIINKDIESNKELEEQVAFICENSSAKERRALTIEREVDDLEAAKYMKDKVGNTYEGMIDGMTNKGMFVELENGIDGYIDYDDLGNEQFIFDEEYMRVFGSRSKITYELGEKVQVLVSKVDLDSYQISFLLINEKKKSKIDNRSNRKEKQVTRKRGRYGRY